MLVITSAGNVFKYVAIYNVIQIAWYDFIIPFQINVTFWTLHLCVASDGSKWTGGISIPRRIIIMDVVLVVHQSFSRLTAQYTAKAVEPSRAGRCVRIINIPALVRFTRRVNYTHILKEIWMHFTKCKIEPIYVWVNSCIMSMKHLNTHAREILPKSRENRCYIIVEYKKINTRRTWSY